MKTKNPGDLNNSLCQCAEGMVSRDESPVLEQLSPEQMLQLIQELRARQVELVKHNDELLRTQHEREESRVRFFQLYDLAPIGYLTIDGQGLILEANLTAANLLRMPRKSLLRQPLSRFFLPEEQDNYYLQRKQLFATVAAQSWEMKLINSAGSIFWAQLNAIPAQNGECRITLEDITRRKEDENIIATNLRLSEFAVNHSLDELLTRIVDEAEKITDSTIGFFHFLEPDQLTLSLQAWSTNTLNTMCTAEGKGQHYSVDKAGVWVDCIHTKRPVIHNDYATLPDRKGMPKGHAPVKRELVVPVFRNDFIVGIIGVGNKPTNYLEQDIEALSRLINFTWDIVMSKMAEESLQKSEHLHRTVLHTQLDGFWIIDRQGRFIDVNEAYCTIIGYTRDELLEMSIQDVEAFEDKAEIDQRMQSIALKGSHRFESQHRCKDGHLVELEICASYLPEHERFCAALHNLTRHKQVEMAIRRAGEEWQNTFSASSDPIFLLDTDHQIMRANAATAAVFGIPVEGVIGRSCHEIIHGCETPITRCPQCLLLEDHQSHSAEVFAEGVGKHFLVTVSPIFDTTGTLSGSIHYAKDITAIKQSEQALANANIDLERKVDERTAELAQAHEQMKRVSFELIWAEEKERERIAGELHDQVGQSLMLAKMKLDGLEDKLSDESLRSSAADAALLVATSIQDIRSLTFRMRPPLLDTAGIDTVLEWLCTSISNDYNLQVNFASDHQPKPLSADARYLLYQSVRELLINVAKHARTERAHLSLATENGTLAIQVADDGAGFNPPEAVLKHVNNGGFGLFNVQQRIEQLVGRVAIESEPGKGTRVTVAVPLSESGS